MFFFSHYFKLNKYNFFLYFSDLNWNEKIFYSLIFLFFFRFVLSWKIKYKDKNIFYSNFIHEFLSKNKKFYIIKPIKIIIWLVSLFCIIFKLNKLIFFLKLRIKWILKNSKIFIFSFSCLLLFLFVLSNFSSK